MSLSNPILPYHSVYDEVLTRYHYRHNRRGATAANAIEKSWEVPCHLVKRFWHMKTPDNVTTRRMREGFFAILVTQRSHLQILGYLIPVQLKRKD